MTTALREGNVAHLLVTEPGGVTVAVGDNPAEVAVTEAELSGLGLRCSGTYRADEALPCAALATAPT